MKIRSMRGYNAAIRKMIRSVQRGYDPSRSTDTQELELLADCIRNGYLIGRVSSPDPKTGVEHELRTLDGKMHPELFNQIVPPKGLAFLKPAASDIRSVIAICISVLALLVSLFANLDRIIQNVGLFRSLS